MDLEANEIAISFESTSVVAGSERASAQSSESDRRLLESWAMRRGKRIVWPSATTTVEANDESLRKEPVSAEEIEKSLESARALRTEGKNDEADALLGKTRVLLLGHADWPEAAWLLAEVERASGHLEAAARIDDGRRIGVAEGGARTTLDVEKPVTLKIELGREGDVAFVDGRLLDASRKFSAGPHAVLVRRSARTVFARWVVFGESDTTFTLPIPLSFSACSLSDLRNATFVECPRWASVRRDGARLVVRACAYETCESESSTLGAIAETKALPVEPPHAPRWLVATAIGASAALFAVGALYTAGAFDKPAVETRVTFGGVQPASAPIRF